MKDTWIPFFLTFGLVFAVLMGALWLQDRFTRKVDRTHREPPSQLDDWDGWRP